MLFGYNGAERRIILDYYLAVDIGASSGRHILGWLEDGILKTEEIYRFENGMKENGGHLCWDIKHLTDSVIAGMKVCKDIGKIPKYMGIDTWAVDYVLLDKDNNIIGKTYGYRDSRTEGMDKYVYDIVLQDELYERTGIQKQIFNTIYQLMAHKINEPKLFEVAEDMLMIPDYLNFMLTGVKVTEYTNATTTQMVNATTNDWDMELIEKLGYPKKIFKHIKPAGSKLGNLIKEIKKEVGYDLSVILPATHDTGSAVLAVPFNGDGVYISSGTWSLMGTELKKPDCSKEAMKANLTNEGGFEYRFRYLKNIMGLWMIQSVRNKLGRKYSFAELCDLAKAEREFSAIVDVNDSTFLAPDNMTEAIKEYCRKTNQMIPETPGQLAKVIYESLSISYRDTIAELESLTGKKYDAIYVVGGGCNADYLNELTAKATGKIVYAGPSEATAIGNILAQMIGTKLINSVEEGRKIVFDSTQIKKIK